MELSVLYRRGDFGGRGGVAKGREDSEGVGEPKGVAGPLDEGTKE